MVREEERGRQLVLDNLAMINRMAVRRFGDRPLAEEAAFYVMNRLLEDEPGKGADQVQRKKLKAYLAARSWNMLEDFARSRFGRKRPPLWIRRLGGIWSHLFSLLCLERLPVMEAVPLAAQIAGSLSTEKEVEEAAWAIRQHVVHCGEHQGLEVELRDELIQQEDDQAERLAKSQARTLFASIFLMLTEGKTEIDEQNLSRLSAFRLQLAPVEKLLLKLCYQDGLSVAAAGRLLEMNNHQVHGRMRRLLERIRNELERLGLDQDVLDLLR